MTLWEGAAAEFFGGCAAAAAIALVHWAIRQLSSKRAEGRAEEDD